MAISEESGISKLNLNSIHLSSLSHKNIWEMYVSMSPSTNMVNSIGLVIQSRRRITLNERVIGKTPKIQQWFKLL